MARKDISDLQVLRAYRQAWAEPKRQPFLYPEQILHAETGEPVKVCLAAMMRASVRDLIDYGVSLRAGWITYKGLAMLAAADGAAPPPAPGSRVHFPAFGWGACTS